MHYTINERLLLQEVDNEIVAVDPSTGKAHCLSPLAADVFECAKECSCLDELTQEFSADNASQGDIESAIGQLVESGILVIPEDAADGTSRRDFLKVAAASGAAVMTLALSSPAAAQSQLSITTCSAGGTLCSNGGSRFCSGQVLCQAFSACIADVTGCPAGTTFYQCITACGGPPSGTCVGCFPTGTTCGAGAAAAFPDPLATC